MAIKMGLGITEGWGFDQGRSTFPKQNGNLGVALIQRLLLQGFYYTARGIGAQEERTERRASAAHL